MADESVASESTDADDPPGRITRIRTNANDRFTEIREKSPVVDGLAATVLHDSEVGGGVMAGALAFRLFLFLVPYVVFMFTAFGATADVANRSAEDLASSVGISGILAKGVINTETLSTGQIWTILFVSGYAMVVAARSLAKTLATAVSLAWKMPRAKVKSTTAGLFFIVFFTIVTLATTELARLRDAAPAPGLALEIAWLAVPFLSVWWLMWKLPHRDAPGWALIPGAIITAAGFQIMHLATVFWIAPSATSKSDTYGIIGISLATLAWCYIAGRLIIGCTVLNAALWRRYEETHDGVILASIEPGAKLVHRIRVWLSSMLELFR